MSKLDFSKYTVLVFDLDGTLIQTKTRNTFPKGIWDMEIKWEVFDAVIKNCPNMSDFLIASNQSGIAKGFVNKESFYSKILYVKNALIDYIEYKTGKRVMGDCRCCSSGKKSHPDRKPNIGMLTGSFVGLQPLDTVLFIGDATDAKRDFSDSDRKCAENFGCDYCDVRDFVKYANT